jgi:hypothetical protein
MMGMQISAAIVEISMRVPQKSKIEWLYDPELPLLSIYPNNCVCIQ